MNTNKQGTLGEVAVIKRLIAENWDIFLPFGGKTTHDIVAYRKDFGTVTIQVKSCDCFNPSGSYSVAIRTVRGNTSKNETVPFNNSLQDILAVYLVDIDTVNFINSSLIKTTRCVTIKELDAINNSEKTLEETLNELPKL